VNGRNRTLASLVLVFGGDAILSSPVAGLVKFRQRRIGVRAHLPPPHTFIETSTGCSDGASAQGGGLAPSWGSRAGRSAATRPIARYWQTD
jgi:hypothetical protein